MKKFIKQIDYAEDQIAVTLYYINSFEKGFVSEGFLKTSPSPLSSKTKKISPVAHETYNLSSPRTGWARTKHFSVITGKRYIFLL